MGVLLLDDRFVLGVISEKWRLRLTAGISRPKKTPPTPELRSWKESSGRYWRLLKLSASAAMLTWIFYVTTEELIWMFAKLPLPTSPVEALEPFRIANRYGLFAVMTRGRYEIEFQGSADGQNWIAYPFRYKPQKLNEPPRIYAPYQPRFDWNLWFASLGSWREYPIVPNTEVLLLSNDKDVLTLFAGNPFSREPPHQIRAVLWQYWFTTMSEKRATGGWWRRQLLGLYAPALERGPDGSIKVVEWPTVEAKQ
jgi:hypothetical protein